MGIEIWKPIPGFNAVYEASTLGRIRRVGNALINRKPNAAYKQSANNHGYHLITVTLPETNKRKVVYVHDLVAAAFHGAKPEGLTVNHIDMNKANNKPDNLEYITLTMNVALARKITGSTVGARNGNAKLSAVQVAEIRRLPRTVSLTEIAETYGIAYTYASTVRNGKGWKGIM